MQKWEYLVVEEASGDVLYDSDRKHTPLQKYLDYVGKYG